jgi:hypothetical protein
MRAVDADILAENTDVVKKTTEALLDARKDGGWSGSKCRGN